MGRVGLAALLLAIPESNAFSTENICIPEQEIAKVAQKIQSQYTQTRAHTYLIKTVQAVKDKHPDGGDLTVNFFSQSRFAVFDRTSQNPMEWYSISNTDGCGRVGMYLKNFAVFPPALAKEKYEAFYNQNK